MLDKVTAPSLGLMRAEGRPIVCITAYDFTFGQIADLAGADVILIGDSLGNVVLGYETTLPVTLEQMVHHTIATRKGVKRALLVADLPFGSYEQSPSQALASAVTLMKSGAEAVKLEGEYVEQIAALTQAGIPVMAHLGYTPQSYYAFGGAKMQGKADDGEKIVEAAKNVCQAGAIAIVLELIPEGLAGKITDAVTCPTIGIGAGKRCSGQIQVLHDVLGLSGQRFRHAMPTLDGRSLFLKAIEDYADQVRNPQTTPSKLS